MVVLINHTYMILSSGRKINNFLYLQLSDYCAYVNEDVLANVMDPLETTFDEDVLENLR